MDRKYTKHDLKTLIHFEWDSFKTSCKVKKTGIWLFKRNTPEYRWLSDEERDLLLSRPDKDTSKPVLPFPFTLDEFLKFATLPALELREFYTFADNTIDENAIEQLGRTHTRAWELARALMFGERPKLAHLEETQGDTASAHLVLVAALEAPSGKKRASSNWKMQIQIEATARTLRLRQSGASPTRHSILGDMVKWCRDNNVKTDGEIFPSAGYLRTHVLGGKHWDVPN